MDLFHSTIILNTLQGPRGLRRGSAAVLLLRLRVRMPEYLSLVCCQIVTSIRQADHSSRGVLLSVMCLSVIVKP